MEIIEKAPAKINLGLDAIRKREDGYHDLEMIMASVDLSDYVSVRGISEKKVVLTTDSNFLPTDKRNHAYQAAILLMKRFDVKTGVEIHIQKNIPVSAGLAGGSSDCAATLRALNKLWNLELSQAQLAEIGAEIGSDVPYCIYGNTAFVTGRGEFVEKIEDMPSCYIIMVKPKMSVSTGSVFKALDTSSAFHPNIFLIKQAVEEKNYPKMIEHMGNTLESVTIDRYPEIEQIKKAMKKFGADVSLMSGSGPTVFCLVKKENRAKRIYNALKGFNDEVYITRPLKAKK
ncbi:4-diphosphocytidyl-2-C-methyl-D-erythritol kinase [Pilibacter termitis]|uniref:4-diphosphocytidyl-2-C-methyl-D-erythritol kinase n=1 Tax=Pilibacter termitis TaxID=263852 RepID=A0A1T4K0K4_9ENTE|nr:4-(cytidine 5'-diphospho)-2-C-methyl-D-erythritol kinase [Pilibacter termitis]SJZ36042.1 4-diphosphocytidyl-2-C-methyl-D-erythritol kinase [Pilibacter termitis]